MKRIVLAVLMLAACGGEESDCTEYDAAPGFCVPHDWPESHFQFLMHDDACREGTTAVVTVFFRGAREGEEMVRCIEGVGECVQYGIENPECCGGNRREHRDTIWACP